MQPIELQAFTYEERHGLVPALISAISLCGAWVIDRKTVSPTAMEVSLEIQLRFILELYAAFVAAGLELTRDSHQALSDLCTCRKHLAEEAGQVVTMQLEVTFLEDVTLHSLLLSGMCAA